LAKAHGFLATGDLSTRVDVVDVDLLERSLETVAEQEATNRIGPRRTGQRGGPTEYVDPTKWSPRSRAISATKFEAK